MYPGKWAEEFPDKVAIIHSTSGATTTYRQLNERSNQLAQLMWARGLRPGDHIAIFMENNLRYFEVMWAALRSGLYLTTVNQYLTDEEAGYIVDNCGADVLIASKRLSDVAGKLKAFAPNCRHWLMVDGTVDGYEAYEDAIASQPTNNLDAEPAGQFMLYSSGTTGRPKGIFRPMLSRGIADEVGPIGTIQQKVWGVDKDAIYLSPAPLYHSAPLAFCHGILANGGTVVMMPKFKEVDALEALDKYKVTHSQWVPTMFTRILKMPAEQREGYDFSAHRVAIHAAAPCPDGIKQQMLDWWGPIIHEYYGGSELNGLTHSGPQDWINHPGTVGKPIFGILHICDDDGKELPANEAGLIYFEMPEIPFVYHGEEDKTKEAQHPQHPNWTALGDVGYMDEDGFLFLTDRATFMIISGGVNIYPQEIEDAIIMHEKVADVAVIGVPNEEMGEEVKAVVETPKGITGDDALAGEILAYAREHIAHYKCPKSVDFIDQLPRLPTGKLYKRILKDKYWGKTDSRIV
ncbi:acyl-CoA synthetase [Gammaproteobacteria bacterium 50_400_T64]|nr:acyl-CoA synthetase [Gammaproteobacteria bacterium 50_400_T64]